MNIRSKIVYGIAGLLAFIPLFILVIVQSIFALEASYDSTLIIDGSKVEIVDIIAYNMYNEDITDLLEANDKDGKPIVFSIIEATDKYILFDFHGGKVDSKQVQVLGIQFVLADGSKTELLQGVVYLRFRNVNVDSWLGDFIEDTLVIYNNHYKQPAGTVSFVWVKIIAASVGTIIGLATVLFVILRKSTKALVKRYWRTAVLVSLIQGTIILGLITWIVADIFQVFAAATVGWTIFLITEKVAINKGYLVSSTGVQLAEDLPPEALVDMQASIDNILAKYRK